MKLQFKQQDFQTAAVNAVTDLFAGQERTRATFSVMNEGGLAGQEFIGPAELGVGNVLRLSDEALTENMRAVQKRNLLPMTDSAASHQFCIEMETGTGKTYVYTKTIFELNRRYGFTKFIVVAPSVAIREGVYKFFQVTEEHFALQYDSVPCRYFIYNSAKLSDVRQFAASANIEVMIINIDAFKKAENVINQAQDRLNGETAMQYIQATRPIVIIDEPQSVDNTPKAKEAIASLHPLCVLRYSATHREKINLLYRLTPVDAYQMGLVKQIAVSSNQVTGGFNQPYVRLLSVSNEKGFRAKVEMDVKGRTGVVARKTVTLKPGDDLFLLSGQRELYEGYTVAGIDCTPGYEHIEFGNTQEVALGKAIGDIDENVVKKAQIRRTNEAHLDKELRYMDKGIKVLSLFFIDKVEQYRREDGTPGICAGMFEECYRELIAKEKYAPIRERFSADVSKIHNGYFSQDKKGRLKDTKGDTQADDDIYNTIIFALPVYRDLKMDEPCSYHLFQRFMADEEKWAQVQDPTSEGHAIYQAALIGLILFAEQIRDFRRMISIVADEYLEPLKHRNSFAYAEAYTDFYTQMLYAGFQVFGDDFEQGVPMEVDFAPMMHPTEKDKVFIAEKTTFDSLVAFLQAEFYRGLARGNAPRRCHNCGRYFLLTSGHNVYFCNNIAPGETKRTCRKVGAHRKEAQGKENHTPAQKEYDKTYNRLKARKRRGKIGKDEWNAAVAKAQELVEQSGRGELSDDELKRKLEEL